MAVEIKKIDYKNFGKCLQLDNGACTAVVTVDCGPRIVVFHLNGKENMFFEDLEREFVWEGKLMDDYYGKGKIAYNYGGHRLWASEESAPETTYPDVNPVAVEYTQYGVILRSNPEVENGIQKIIKFELDEEKPVATVKHDVINISSKPKLFAPWALTVLAAGGTEIIPQPMRDTGLVSNRKLILWPYTDMSDDRLYWGKEFITLKQDENKETPIKLGINLEDGYACYVNRGQIFIKRIDHHIYRNYPDYGCSLETYTNSKFLELESLGEYKTVEPNDTLVHTETWELKESDGQFDRKDPKSIKSFVEKNVL